MNCQVTEEDNENSSWCSWPPGQDGAGFAPNSTATFSVYSALLM
jgi:hypothetical protein